MSVLSWSISRTRPKLNSSLCHQNCYVSHFTPHWVLFIFAYLREKKKRRICLYICLLPICPSTYLPVCLSVYPISVYLLTCLSIWYLSVCLSTYLSLSVYSSCTSLSPVQLVTWGSRADRGSWWSPWWERPAPWLWLAFISLWLTCRVKGMRPGSQGPCFSHVGPTSSGELVPSIPDIFRPVLWTVWEHGRRECEVGGELCRVKK